MIVNVSKVHQRICWDCGNIAEHSNNMVPDVLCKKCGSQDTRLVKNSSGAIRTTEEINSVLLGLIECVEKWAEEEDGIPSFCWQAYFDALAAVGRHAPNQGTDTKGKAK